MHAHFPNRTFLPKKKISIPNKHTVPIKHISPNRFPVRGSYSFERGACTGRMILRWSPGLFSCQGHAGFFDRMISHLSPTPSFPFIFLPASVAGPPFFFNGLGCFGSPFLSFVFLGWSELRLLPYSFTHFSWMSWFLRLPLSFRHFRVLVCQAFSQTVQTTRFRLCICTCCKMRRSEWIWKFVHSLGYGRALFFKFFLPMNLCSMGTLAFIDSAPGFA